LEIASRATAAKCMRAGCCRSLIDVFDVVSPLNSIPAAAKE